MFEISRWGFTLNSRSVITDLQLHSSSLRQGLLAPYLKLAKTQSSLFTENFVIPSSSSSSSGAPPPFKLFNEPVDFTSAVKTEAAYLSSNRGSKPRDDREATAEMFYCCLHTCRLESSRHVCADSGTKTQTDVRTKLLLVFLLEESCDYYKIQCEPWNTGKRIIKQGDEKIYKQIIALKYYEFSILKFR